VVSAMNTAVNLGFLDRSRYIFIQVAGQLSSRGLVDPVPDPLLLKKSGRAENRTRKGTKRHLIHSQKPKAGIVKSVEMSIARQLLGKHIPASTNMQATVE
jgi:hypothetical protein